MSLAFHKQMFLECVQLGSPILIRYDESSEPNRKNHLSDVPLSQLGCVGGTQLSVVERAVS
jgi:hypothetical protein